MEIKNNHNFPPIQGKYVNLREVQLSDAEFILSLRCDPKKARFLHYTENNLDKQIEYLKRYFTLDQEWYFIIENKKHEPLGTTRIYDVKGLQYTPGSWLMKDGSLPEETLEGVLLVNRFTFEDLGFERAIYDVRKNNKKVVKYHLLRGAKIIGENDTDYIFELTSENYYKITKPLYDVL